MLSLFHCELTHQRSVPTYSSGLLMHGAKRALLIAGLLLPVRCDNADPVGQSQRQLCDEGAALVCACFKGDDFHHLKILRPNGGETFIAGTADTIKICVTEDDQVWASQATYQLSLDGGVTWYSINPRYESELPCRRTWDIPATFTDSTGAEFKVESTRCKLRVQAYTEIDPTGQDMDETDGFFTIASQ